MAPEAKVEREDRGPYDTSGEEKEYVECGVR